MNLVCQFHSREVQLHGRKMILDTIDAKNKITILRRFMCFSTKFQDFGYLNLHLIDNRVLILFNQNN